MTTTKFWVSLSFMAVMVSLANVARAQEKDKKAVPDLPARVADAVKARLPGARINAAEKENEHGTVVYDLELTQNGLKYEMDVTADGTILEIEKEVKDPPPAVSRAILSKYPGSRIKLVMQVRQVKGRRETPKNYEATISTGGKEKEVIVALDGSSVKEEAEETPQKN